MYVSKSSSASAQHLFERRPAFKIRPCYSPLDWRVATRDVIQYNIPSAARRDCTRVLRGVR